MPASQPAALDATTDSYHISQYLATLQVPGWIVHPRVVQYTDQAHKDNQVARLERELDKADIKGEWKNVQMRDYTSPDTLATAFQQSLRKTGTIIWMSGNRYHFGDKKEEAGFHSFLLLYKDEVVVLVDPAHIGDYAAKVKRIGDLGGGLGSLVKPLLKMMKGKKKVKSVWIGDRFPGEQEREFNGANCNDMCQVALEVFGKEGGRWGRNWEEEGFMLLKK